MRLAMMVGGGVLLLGAIAASGWGRLALLALGGALVLFATAPGTLRVILPFWFGYRATVKGTVRWAVRTCSLIKEKYPNASMHEIFRLALRYRYVDFAVKREPELLSRAVELLEDPLTKSEDLRSFVLLILNVEGELRMDERSLDASMDVVEAELGRLSPGWRSEGH
jgi:hypothetical protein